MCNADCCCKDLSRDGLIKFLLTFTAINLALSIVLMLNSTSFRFVALLWRGIFLSVLCMYLYTY